MKHLIYLFASIWLCACHGFEADITFQYVDPLNKVLPEGRIFVTSDAQADVVRGEHATWQFAFSCNRDVTALKAHIGVFTDTVTGEKLDSPSRLSFVGNVHVGRAQMTPAKDILMSPSGFYPDPLLDDETADVPANTSQAIWISLPVTAGCKPGVYETLLTIEGKSAGASFRKQEKLRLKIYSPLVEEQTLTVTNWYQPGFSYVDGEDVPQFSPRWWELMEQMAGYMKEYRQNVVLISPLNLAQYKYDKGNVQSIDFGRFDEVVNFFLERKILQTIAGGHIAGRFGGWESDFGYSFPVEEDGKTVFKRVPCNDARAKVFYKFFFGQLMKHLETKGWKEMYIQHIADEPIKSNAQSYIAISSYIKSLCPGLKLVDACHTKDLDNQIDVWIPQLNYLHRDFDFYRAQQQKGKEVWYYTCVWPQGEYANRFIQQPLIKTRLLHWINYKYGINGYLHWGLNFWRGPDPMVETAAIQPDGLVLPAGDAWVVYPYKKHLIPSIRLEAMRDGIIDYELLKMLEKRNPEKATQLTAALIYDFDKYDTDIAHFRAIRRQLLEALENENKK